MAITVAGKRYTLSARRLWMCIPILLPYLADVCLTLIGQPSAYWGSGYQYVDETNPLGYWLLHLHPLLFINFQVLVFCGYLLLIALLPVKWSKLLMVYLTMAHTYAAYGWLKYVLQVNYFVRFGLILVPALLLMYALGRVEEPGSDTSQSI